MKALTIWQPYATFIAAGIKRYETRSWCTSHRGELAIHAAKLKRPDLKDYLETLKVMYSGFDQFIYEQFPFGCIVAICNLKRVSRTQDCVPHLSEIELAVGDYSIGRFAWELEEIEILTPPIPAVGKQGMWEWEPERV